MAFKIWVDADACPKAVKEVLFRAAERTQTEMTLVANHSMQVPPSPYIRLLTVGHGFDVADDRIAAMLEPGDLVITGDIPLAAEVLERKALALNPRGEQYDPDTIRAKLTMRDFMDTMRSSGVVGGGPSAFGPREKQAFANALDRILAQVAGAK